MMDEPTQIGEEHYRAPVIVENESGFHARPVAKFVERVGKGSSEVTVRLGDRAVNGSSILDLLAMGAESGTKVIIEARGPDARTLLFELAEIVARGSEE
jgi:phosphotransferase system HPr (HPr) family protein